MNLDFVPLIRWLINAVRRQASTPSTATTPGSLITTPTSIHDMPTEILHKIFSYLTIKERFVCERVCHRWQQSVLRTIDKLSCTELCNCDFHSTPRCINSYVYRELNIDILKRILSKCGQHLLSIEGWVSRPMAVSITEHCVRLHSIDMEFEDFESLQFLCNQLGKQLKCAVVSVIVPYSVKPILDSCPNLEFLTVRWGIYCWSESKNGTKDVSDLARPNPFHSLRNLVFQGCVTTEILRGITLLTRLEMVRLDLRKCFIDTEKWTSAVKAWAGLKSLTLEINTEDYVHLVSFPSHLEYLEINADQSTNKGITEDYAYYQIPNGFVTVLPKLKSARIDQSYFNSGFFSSVIHHLAVCCPNIEELAAGRFYSEQSMGEFMDETNMDEGLTPLLSLSSLRKLSLEFDFSISDKIASKLVSDLPCLTSLGGYKDEYRQYFMPAGEAFWEALRCKALSRPSEIFDIIGCANDIIYLNWPLPSNIHLCLKFYAEVNISNGFGQSRQWQDLIDRSWDLSTLFIELQDINRNLIALPGCVERLTIKCLNDNQGTNNDALTFNTNLPDLSSLNIHQANMSNAQLGATVECITNCCPNLEFLSINRSNEEPEPVDRHLEHLLDCLFLKTTNVAKNFVLSDAFIAKLANANIEVQNNV